MPNIITFVAVRGAQQGGGSLHSGTGADTILGYQRWKRSAPGFILAAEMMVAAPSVSNVITSC